MHTLSLLRTDFFSYRNDPALEASEPTFIKGCRASSWWLICWDEARSRETWRAYNVSLD